MIKAFSTALIAVTAVGCADADHSTNDDLRVGGLPFVEAASTSEHVSPHARGIEVLCRDGECLTQSAVRTLSNLSPEEAAQKETAPDAPRSILVLAQRHEAESAQFNRSEVSKEALRFIAEGKPESPLEFKIWLHEPEFDFRPLRHASGRDREEFLAKRAAILAPSQARVEGRVRDLGGDVVARRVLTNGLLVRVPARVVDELLGDSEVYAAYLGSEVQVEIGGDGVDRLNALSQAGPPTETGATGGNLGGVVWIGLVEAPTYGGGLNNLLNTSALALRDGVGNSRAWYNRMCNASNCVAGGTGTLSTHATWVASVAAGDLRAQQDANYPGSDTVEQRRRSGLARGSHLALFRLASNHSDDMETAIENAVAFGVDVLNISMGAGTGCSQLCNRNHNPSGINADLYAANEAGIVIVKSAGNEHGECGPSLTCDVTYPAWHPDVIAVSELADNQFGGTTFPWQDQVISSLSSRGFRNHIALDGQVAEVPTVGLSTFGTVRWVSGENPSHYVTLAPWGETISGTSLAAPQVSSLAALFRQWFRSHNATLASDAWFIQVNLLAMGDGKCGADCTLDRQIDDEYGFGFSRFFVPTGTYLGGGGGWGTRSDVITQGGVKFWDVGGAGQEANNINGFKLVVALDTTLASPPALNVWVRDTCPDGPVGFSRTAVRQGTRYRVLIDDPAEIRGKCLRVIINGLNVKAGGEVFYATDYYWTSTSAYHLED